MAFRIKPAISEPIQTVQPVESEIRHGGHPIRGNRFYSYKHHRPLRLAIGSCRAGSCLSRGRSIFLISA